MPIYQYRCADCGNELEVQQKFSDAALTLCPECAGTLRKVYNAVGIVFKGSGFYATDNRTKTESGTETKPKGKDDSKPSTEAKPKKEKAAKPAKAD